MSEPLVESAWSTTWSIKSALSCLMDLRSSDAAVLKIMGLRALTIAMVASGHQCSLAACCKVVPSFHALHVEVIMLVI